MYILVRKELYGTVTKLQHYSYHHCYFHVPQIPYSIISASVFHAYYCYYCFNARKNNIVSNSAYKYFTKDLI
jgi:hypothetical protein